jgi:hypothetical protein
VKGNSGGTILPLTGGTEEKYKNLMKIAGLQAEI